MARKIRFKRLPRPQPRLRRTARDLRSSVAEAAAAWFQELTGLRVLALGLPPESFAEPAMLESFQHPRCAGCPPVREGRAWTQHLVELQKSPEAHWHRCESGQLCAVVPAVMDGHCLAVCKLVEAGHTDQREFKRKVQLLNVLVEACVAARTSALRALIEPSAERGEAETAVARRRHRGVRAALDHIDEHLANPALTVRRVAGAVGMNSTYLGHLFAHEVGLPMHRYIADQRLERAKALLTSTPWTVKHIARATGHGNPDWFSHLFRCHTGMTPTAYRLRARDESAGP